MTESNSSLTLGGGHGPMGTLSVGQPVQMLLDGGWKFHSPEGSVNSFFIGGDEEGRQTGWGFVGGWDTLPLVFVHNEKLRNVIKERNS